MAQMSVENLDSNLAVKAPRTVALVTLGCARNEVDSEELAEDYLQIAGP